MLRTNILIFLFFIFCSPWTCVLAQSIVNTEKLFKEKKKGFALSTKASGNIISGNADISLFKFAVNTGYLKEKWTLKLISGGQNLVQNGNNINSSLFSQLRFNYFINSKLRLLTFFQIQSNNILLLNRRVLGGLGIRRNVLGIGDSSKQFKLDVTLGAMQEEEVLDRINLPNIETYYTNYTRGTFVLNAVFEVTDRITIINTTYLQQRFKDLNDIRLLNELNLNIPINKSLMVTFDFEYRFDSKPPSVLKGQDFNNSIGLRLNI